MSWRRLVIVEGERAGCVEAAEAMVRALPAEEVIRVASDADRAAVRAVLGCEAQVAVVDLHPGLEPDVLGAVHGVVRGGGWLVLLCPPLDTWAERREAVAERMAVWPYSVDDVGTRFVRRFVRLLRESGVEVWEARADLPRAPAPEPRRRGGAAVPRTEDQRRAVEALAGLAADPPRPVVLTSDRGRGKSGALGLAVPSIAGRVRRVFVTAPSREAAGEVLRFAGDAPLAFVSPEEAAARCDPEDALLIDEAAALPLPLLERLLRTTPRIAFATTVHGYEGTGRGFLLRFLETLRARCAALVEVHLSEPIRFAADDPVEALVHRLLALDVSLGTVPNETSGRHEVIDREVLADDERLLRQVFGLLVHAHYRTTPGDLRRLLDAPNLAVHVLRSGTDVLAAALVAREGGLDRERLEGLGAAGPRIRGHVLPENLACHLGVLRWGVSPMQRVVRIAVHPEVRRRGVGTELLGHVVAEAEAEGAVLVGSLFGASAELLRFWHAAGFRTVRLSGSRSARSGEHSALVLAPLTPDAGELVATLRRRLARDLPYALGDVLRDLPPEVALEALRGSDPDAEPPLDDADRAALADYTAGRRPYDATVRPLVALASAAVARSESALGEEGARVLVLKVLERRPWPEVARAIGAPSVPSAMRAVRAAVAALTDPR